MQNPTFLKPCTTQKSIHCLNKTVHSFPLNNTIDKYTQHTCSEQSNNRLNVSHWVIACWMPQPIDYPFHGYCIHGMTRNTALVNLSTQLAHPDLQSLSRCLTNNVLKYIHSNRTKTCLLSSRTHLEHLQQVEESDGATISVLGARDKLQSSVTTCRLIIRPECWHRANAIFHETGRHFAAATCISH